MIKKIVPLLLCISVILISLSACTQSQSKLESNNLKNKKIAVIKGSESIEVSKNFTEKGCELMGYYTVDEIAEAIKSHKMDCAILDRNIADEFIKSNPEFTVSDSTVGNGSVRFTATESKKMYTIMLNKALTALKEDGTLDAIIDGYLGSEPYTYQLSNGSDNSNGDFTIALDTDISPYSYDDTINLTGGISVAAVDAICKYLGCGYTILPVSTSSLAQSVRMGEADFAIGSFDPMEQFFPDSPLSDSEPVLEFDYVILSLK